MVRTTEAEVKRSALAQGERHYGMPWWLPAWVPIVTVVGTLAIAAVVYALIRLGVGG